MNKCHHYQNVFNIYVDDSVYSTLVDCALIFRDNSEPLIVELTNESTNPAEEINKNFTFDKHNTSTMKPKEIASLFSDYIEQGSTPKGMKVQSFFGNLSLSQKALVSKNIAKAYSKYLEDEKAKAEERKKKSREIAQLKKRAKELGFTLSEI